MKHCVCSLLSPQYHYECKRAKLLLWQQLQIMETTGKIKARLDVSVRGKGTGATTGQHCGQISVSRFNGERQRHTSPGKRLSPIIKNKRRVFPHPGNQDKDRFCKITLKLVRLWTSESSSHSGITKPNVAFPIAINKLELFSRAVQMSEPLLNWPGGRKMILMMYDKTCITKSLQLLDTLKSHFAAVRKIYK